MLTVHQLASVVAADLSPESLEHDVRRARRFPYHGQIRISINADDDAETEDVSVMDLSARGLRFVHSTRFARGATFVARLPRYGSDELVILCTVAHCQVRPNGMFTVGVEFTCVMSEPTQPAARVNDEDRIRDAILARPGN